MNKNSYDQVQAQVGNDTYHDYCLAESNFKTQTDFRDVKMGEKHTTQNKWNITMYTCLLSPTSKHLKDRVKSNLFLPSTGPHIML